MEWGKERHCEMRKMRGRLRGKGRRPGGGAGNTGAGPKRSGLGEDCGFGRRNGGANGQRYLKMGYKTTGEASCAEAPKKWPLALRGGEGGRGRERELRPPGSRSLGREARGPRSQ